MLDLDGSAASAVVKPKPVVQKMNAVESSKRDAQNYFKTLSATVKKPTPLTSLTTNVKQEKNVSNLTQWSQGHARNICMWLLSEVKWSSFSVLCTLINGYVSIFQEENNVQIDPPKKLINQDTEPVKTTVTSNKSTKKTEWKIDKEIKQELEDSATQNIEEFHTQDIDFDDDFSNDTAPPATAKVTKTESKEEPSAGVTITDVAEEFLNDDFEIFPAKKQSPKELKPLTSTWNEIGDNQGGATGTSVHTDGQLPLQTNEKGEKVLKFYWLDAWEDRFVKPGVVYLFGKVYAKPSDKKAGCLSCCVVVKNVTRQMFLLPREYVSIYCEIFIVVSL